jgi:excisionase family DNA binding protein
MEKAEFKAFLKESLIDIYKDIDLKEFLQKAIDEIPKKEYATVKEVAEYFNVARQTIYNWEKKGIVTKYKIGGRTLCKIPEIEEKMKKQAFMFGKEG